jgi:hypothetical protein
MSTGMLDLRRDALTVRLRLPLPACSPIAALAVAAAVLTAGTAGGVAFHYYRESGSVSQADIEAHVSAMHTALAVDTDADSTTGTARGWLVRGRTTPPGMPWYWHAAVIGGPDPRYSIRAVRWKQGWAKTRRDARAQRDAAIQALATPVDDAQ